MHDFLQTSPIVRELKGRLHLIESLRDTVRLSPTNPIVEAAKCEAELIDIVPLSNFTSNFGAESRRSNATEREAAESAVQKQERLKFKRERRRRRTRALESLALRTFREHDLARLWNLNPDA